jgi:hypothetical protein
MNLELFSKFLATWLLLKMLFLVQSCQPVNSDYFHVFEVKLITYLDNNDSQVDYIEFEPLVDLFNNTRYTYYLSGEKEKVVNKLFLDDQQFRLTEVYEKGSIDSFQFINYMGMSFKMKKQARISKAVKGLEWDLVEMKSRKKTFWGFNCHFAEGFSIVDGVDYSISGYICPDFKKNLSYVQGTDQMELSGFWAEVDIRIDGLLMEYRISNYSQIPKAEVVFPNEEDYDTLEFDENFTNGFTKWLQN